MLPDATTERTVELTAGTRVSIADFAAGAFAKDVRLFDDDRTEWPLVTFRFASMTTYDASSRLAAGTLLAPVPAARVRATFTDAEDHEREAMLPAGK